MKIAAVIVNYCTPDMTARATDALLAELPAGVSHLYLVDNDSGDGSFEQLRREHETRGWGERVSVLAAPRNGGYGYGINFAVARALATPDPPEYIYLLNSDAFPDPGSVARLIEFMDGHPEAGIAGSLIHAPDGEMQAAAFRFPTVWSELEHAAGFGVMSKLLRRYIVSLPESDEHREVDWVPGTSMLIRRRVFETAGLFDEGFFLYYEETDFCRRAQRSGWKTFSVAHAPITHIGSVSTGLIEARKPWPRYWFDSRHRYFFKHHGRAYGAACDLAFVAGYAINRAKIAVQRRKPYHRPRMFRDLLASSLRDLPKLRIPGPDEARVMPKSHEALEGARALHDTRAADELDLLELLSEDLATHDGDPLEPGLLAIAAHRLGRRALGARPGSARLALEAAHRLLGGAADWIWGIHLPRSVRLGRRVRIWHSGAMVLRAREIGDDVHIRHDTTFGPAAQDDAREHEPEALPSIQDRADIGSGTAVLGAITVGHDALVGANSVVLKNVPPHATVLGVPARIVPA